MLNKIEPKHAPCCNFLFAENFAQQAHDVKQHRIDVDDTSWRRICVNAKSFDVASTSIQRCFKVVCLLGVESHSGSFYTCTVSVA